MKNFIRCAFILTSLVLGANQALTAQSCDDFNRANSTTVDGWTEQTGDWSILSNTLAAPASIPWNYITRDGSNQADGCITARITYGPVVQLQFAGLVGRYTDQSFNILFKLQDNTNSGYWNAYYIYSDGAVVNSNVGLNFGTDPNVQMEYSGSQVNCRVDIDRNGTWEFTYTATVSNVTVGLSGVVAYNACYFDDWCYSACCAIPEPAAAITGSSIVCDGQSGVTYSVPPIPGANTYTWTWSGTGVTINGTGPNVTLDFAPGAGSGELTVCGQNLCGVGFGSVAFPVIVDPCTNLGTEPVPGGLKVFPNPSGGAFSLEFNLNRNTTCRLKIMDATGILVWEQSVDGLAGSNLIKLDPASLSNGVYFLNFEEDNNVQVRPLIIMK